ncbi:MAG: InlB B-repeat-containing protein, partial [Oscillospiraceae bacterium]|nr:InlB B-repeat-containing protein [Oscillospiraceae bacterium]
LTTAGRESGLYAGGGFAETSISITGSTVTATSSDGDGIFADYAVTITNSTVTATGSRYGIIAVTQAITISGTGSVVIASGGRMALRTTNGGVTLNDGLVYIEGSADATRAVIAKTYAITVEDAANGAVTADRAKTVAGDTVTLTVTPAAGYELDTLTVKQGEADVATVKVDDTTYTFTMPAGAVTVSATFKGLPLTGTVSVSGTPTYGETLIAAYTSGNNTGTLTYQWLRGGTAIDGATGTSYTLTGDDVGQTIACRVSSSVQTGTLASDSTAAVAKAIGTADEAQGEMPTARTGLAYTGEPQELVTAPTTLPEGYDKVQYSTDGGTTWGDAIPTGTDAGDYTVSVRYVGDKNHEDFTITPLPVTIKAVWTVKFEMGGAAAIDDQKIVDGEKLAKPADPAWDGYSFDGWYADEDFKTAFDFDSAITADTTVYAKWTAIPYTITSITGATTDNSHTWRKGSSASVVITVKPTEGPDHSFSHFTGVQIDGKDLTLNTDYTAREGSTIVTLKPATLEKLSVGVHTVTILFDNGSLDTRLTVKAASTSPATGDDRVTGLWAVLTILSALGMGGVTVFTKKRRYSGKH